MRAFEQQPSPRQRFFIDLAETTPSAPSRPPVYGNAIVAASPPVPWPPPLASTPRGLHGARLRQAHSPRPYSVARHAVATVTGHPRAFASPLPGYTLQSPRRLAPQEVYEMNPRSPRQPVGEQGVPAVPVRRFQQVHVAPPRENGVSLDQGQGMAAPVPAPPLEAPGTLVPGTELQVGYLRLRCEELLGSGSYSTVWLAKVVPQRQSSAKLQENQEEVKSVALKDVFCRGEAALQQSLFEVQLLMAVERRMSRNKAEVSPPRLPRCLTYQVDASEEGWSVRMALTRLKGEQLDGWLQRSCEVNGGHFQRPWTDQLHGGCILARQLLQQLGPTLQNLAPLAWHRDVNSHNVPLVTSTASHHDHGRRHHCRQHHQAGMQHVLICNEDSEDGMLSANGQEEKASFWLCDLGLAVDSQSWTGEESLWRVTDIGGDCRYWPASCWMVHCYGADYLEERPHLCKQYQSRLDIHALGITAIEILCTGALALRSAGAPAGDTASCWSELLDAWKQYHETVSDWWQAIYSVFSAGGDFRPVHAWLVEINAPDKVLDLVSAMRKALASCAEESDPSTAHLLRAVAEATNEDSNMDLMEICKMADVIPGPCVNGTGASAIDAKPHDTSSVGSADMAAGTQEGLLGVMAENDKSISKCEIIQREASAPTPGLPNGRSTLLLKAKLEEEHARLSGDLQRLQLHRSRVVLAKSILQQLPQSLPA